MRAVAPDRRPPVAAWGFAALALAPLGLSWAGGRFGWPGPFHAAGVLWAMILLGLSAGMVAGPLALRGRWGGALAALVVLMMTMAVLWSAPAQLDQAVLLGLALVYLIDLWAARIGLMPEWWPRLKLGFTVVAGALLLSPGIG